MKKILIFILIVLSFLFIFKNASNSVPLMENLYPDININIKTNDKINLYKDGTEIKPVLQNQNPYIIYQIKNSPVKELSFNTEKTPENIVITTGINVFYYTKNDISNFEKSDNFKYILPKEVTKSVNKGFFKHFTNIFLANTFLILCLFICFIFKKMPKNSIIWLIILLGTIFRLADINANPFWWDELYTSTMAGNPVYPFISVFLDPGNPPLFFALSKIYLKIINCNMAGFEWALRLLPAIFSILTIYTLYIFVKENFNKKAAILASFLFAINPYSIYSAGEYRGYSLCIFLLTLASIFLFRIIKKNKNKDFIIYAILAALIANTYWFGIFVLIGNFIWGMFFVKNRLKFFYANLFAAFTFLPYFLGSMFVTGALNSDFNDWGPTTALETLNIFSKLFFAKISTLIICIISLWLFIKKKNSKIYTYSVYSILFLFIFAFILSSLVKPVIREYYFIVIIYLICTIAAIIFFIPFKNKILKYTLCLLFIVFYLHGGHYIKRDELKLVNVDFLFKYAYFDNMENSTILFPGLIYYSQFYKNYTTNNPTIIDCPTNIKPYQIYGWLKTSNKGIYYIKVNGKDLLALVKDIEGQFKYEYVLGDKNLFTLKVYHP